jgi:hypothetical protein
MRNERKYTWCLGDVVFEKCDIEGCSCKPCFRPRNSVQKSFVGLTSTQGIWMNFDVHFGSPGSTVEFAEDDTEDDDELLAVTPPDVVELLGFDRSTF